MSNTGQRVERCSSPSPPRQDEGRRGPPQTARNRCSPDPAGRNRKAPGTERTSAPAVPVFHISTFIWFLAQLALMFFLFQVLFDSARPDPANTYFALFAAALYGLHPAVAETVNYI